MSEPDSRKLADLRVVQLRTELEKRGLDKTGVKQILVERLQKALIDEGLDPEVYQFDMTDKKQKAPSASNNPENEDEINDDTIEKEGEQAEKKEEGQEIKEATNDDAKKVAETDTEAKAEQKDQDENKEKNQENKEESPIQLTIEEEEVLQDNDAENGDNAAKENASNTDEKKSTKDAPETSKDTSEINPAQQDAKKDEKTTGENSETAGNPKIKGISDSQNRNLWITNISQNTRATELKQALSAYGKVIGAKVVINARYPGACCYGYVKMETVEDANNCISKLNNTELNGQIIRIEKVRPEHLNPNLNINKRIDREKSRPKSSSMNKNDKDDKARAHNENRQERKLDKSAEKKDKPDDPNKAEGSIAERQGEKRSRSGDRKSHDRRRKRSRSRDRAERSLSSKSRRREREMVLTFDKIKDERDRERKRERERLMREEKRRREEALRQREIERRQRNEAQRLERERDKLRVERERLEKERADLMLLERERQKLEREKLELEKLELERVKMRIQEEERRKRPAPYSRDRPYEERKRVAGERHFDEPPPPPRFDPPPSAKTQQPSPPSNKFKSPNKTHTNLEKGNNFPQKRDRHYENERSHPPQPSPAIQQRPSSQSMVKYNSEVFNFNRERDARDAPPRGREAPGPAVSKYNSQVPKESRYTEHERERSPHFRGGVRDDRDRRPLMGDHKADMRSSRDHRYNDPPKDPGRFERGSGGGGGVWGHSSQGKVFNSNTSNAPQKSWGKDSWRQNESSGGSDRWNSSGSRNGAPLSGGGFSNNSNMMNMGPSCPPPPGINNYVTDRYDYKGSMSYIRK